MSEHLSGSQRSVGRGTGRGLATSRSSTSPQLKGKAMPTPPQKRLPTLERKSDRDSGGQRTRPLPPPKSKSHAEVPTSVAPPKPHHKKPGVHGSRQGRSSGVFQLARAAVPPEIKEKPVALATEDYDAENHREISFKKDDKIYVTFYSPLTSWWKGWIGGEMGYFPREYVKPLFDVDEIADAKTKSATIRDGSSTQDKKRRQLISSIASTEEQYVKDLQLIPEVIKRELQSVVSSSEASDIFGNIETVCSEAKTNLQLFIRKAKTEEPVGDVFLRMAHLFEDEVVVWANHLPQVIYLMERLNFSNPEYAQSVDTIQEKLGGMTVYDWFAKPVRRALECSSIVKMLLMKTPQDNGDYADLTEAQETLTRLRETLKQPMEEIENLIKITSLQGALQGHEPLATPHRKFVREHSIQEVLRGGKKASERKVVLLTDQLVIVKVKKTGYGQGQVFPLSRVQCSPVSDQSNALKNCFELTVSLGGVKKEKRRFGMIAAAERDAFLQSLHSTTNALGASPVSRESQVSLHAQGSTESLPKRGIFQKLRSTRSLSIGGDEDSLPSAASSTRPSIGNRQSSVTNASPMNKSPRAVDTKSPRFGDKGRDSSASRSDSALRGTGTVSASPRSWATASASNAVDSRASSADSSMSRDSGPTETTTHLSRGSSVQCTACGEPVIGSALNSKGKYFHSACYSCFECGKSLIGIPFAEKRGVPYCRECALSLFSEPCAGCHKLITGQFLSAFGEKFHPACFQCAGGCGTNVSRGFASRGGKPYCRSCAKNVPRDPPKEGGARRGT